MMPTVNLKKKKYGRCVMVLLKVCVDLGYSNPTCFQTRDPKLQKWMFLLFVHREFIFYPIMVFLNEFLRKIPFIKIHGVVMSLLPLLT